MSFLADSLDADHAFAYPPWSNRSPSKEEERQVKLTPIHLALGVNSGDLSMDLVREACAQAVKERDDLDWKSALPLTLPADNTAGRNEQQDELAKDIAAMANTRGGLIAYGVAQKKGTNAASGVVSVGEPDDVTIQNIRRVASSLISPPVTGLTFHWLLAKDNDDVVLVLEISRSVEAPHLVRPKKQPPGTGFWFAVPYRNGPDTEWMPEKMIESAYRDRLANRRQREQDLRQLHADLVTSASLIPSPSVVAFARPENPLPASPRILNQLKAAGIFQRAWNSPWKDHFHSLVSAEWVLSDAETKPGLRRFRQTGTHLVPTRDGGVNHWAIAELHSDGSVGFALARGGAFGPTEQAQPGALGTVDLDQCALNLFILAQHAAGDLRIPGDFEVRLSVEPANTRFRVPGDTRPFSAENRIPPFQPVEGAFLLSEDLDVALSSLTDIASDAVNQTGTQSRLDARDLKLAYDLDD
jgi:Putative DNA-binding domain